jgi:hypothetical protein
MDNETSAVQRDREIRQWSERLSDKAENGQLEPIEGSRVYRGEAPAPMNEEDLLAVFQGRPREELSRPAKKTWRIRTTEELDAWAAAGAKEESINTSALVRKAVAEYLGRHHRTARPA